MLTITIFLATPQTTNAGILSFVTSLFANENPVSDSIPETNSQKMPILEAPLNADTHALSLKESVKTAPVASATPISATPVVVNPSKIDTTPLPSTTNSDITSNKITNYKVQKGDTIGEIAEHFGITTNTILWANNLKKTSTISVGQNLVILPTSGVEHKVIKGDTFLSIAAQYKADLSDILDFNNMSKSDPLTIGEMIVIPNGAPQATSKSQTASATIKATTVKVASAALGINIAQADEVGYYMRPIKGGVKTQGIHDTNAVDLADACGTQVYASAAGTVTVSKDNGSWNGGFGNYVVLDHSNGSQTLYAHLSSVSVNEGDQVAQGQVIGLMGETGKATGCHVHFEIRNGIVNPF